jgi:hypothetical protein
VNAALEAVPAHPRSMVVAFRSWAGSPQSLVAAGHDLLAGNPLFSPKGGRILWFEDPSAPAGYMVVGSFLFQSAASISQARGLLQSIEERLNDGHPPAAGGLLTSKLLWVEGVQVDTPPLELPSSDILDTPWGLNAFMASAEDPFAQGCKVGTENIDLCRAVDKKFRHSKLPQAYETPLDMWLGGALEDGLESWGHAHARDEEVLAVAVDALLAASAARHLLETEPAQGAHLLFERATEAVGRRRADDVVPLEVPLPATKPEDRVKLWLEAVRSAAKQHALQPRRAVVFALGQARVRGAILGSRAEAGASPLLSALAIEINLDGGAPGEPKGWSVSTRVAPPSHPPRP